MRFRIFKSKAVSACNSRAIASAYQRSYWKFWTQAVHPRLNQRFPGLIVQGRELVCAMEKSFVLANIEGVASECLNFNDYWEYRRFLELCKLLDNDLTKRIAQIGLSSLDPDVLEASNDFL